MKYWLKKMIASGDLFVWASGAGLAVALLMVLGLLLLIAANGMGFFWTGDIIELTLKDGTRVMGTVLNSWDPTSNRHYGYGSYADYQQCMPDSGSKQ